MPLVGGASDIKTADEEIQKLIELIREDLEGKTGRKFNSYNAVSYKTQVVAGTNYFVKIDVGNEEFVHVRLYQPLPGQGELTLHSHKTNQKNSDELAYF